MSETRIMNVRQVWTQADIDRLTNLWIGGRCPSDIALDMERSTASIINKASRIGLKRDGFWTPKLEQELREFWAIGRSVGWIAAYLKVSKGSVCGKVRRLGLEKRGNFNEAGDRNPAFRGGEVATRARRNAKRRERYQRLAHPEKPPSDLGPAPRAKPGRLLLNLGLVGDVS